MEKAVFISNVVMIVLGAISLIYIIVTLKNEGKNFGTLYSVETERVTKLTEVEEQLTTINEKVDELLCEVGDNLFILVDFDGYGKIRGIYDGLNLAEIARDEIYDKEHENCSIYTVRLNENLQPGQLEIDHIVK